MSNDVSTVMMFDVKSSSFIIRPVFTEYILKIQVGLPGTAVPGTVPDFHDENETTTLLPAGSSLSLPNRLNIGLSLSDVPTSVFHSSFQQTKEQRYYSHF